MNQWTLTRTFLVLCGAICLAAVVVGQIASDSLEDSGWLGMLACALALAALTVVARRHRTP